jgi:hypothetical protein
MAHGVFMGGTYTKREKESDKLRMGGGSWTINLDELPKNTQRVRYITEKATYEVEMGVALLQGFERVLGGERKLVLPISKWSVKEM